MDLYDSRVIEDAIKRITMEAEVQTTALADAPSHDIGSYLRRVGRVAGLREAIFIIEQVKRDFGCQQTGGPMTSVFTKSYEE